MLYKSAELARKLAPNVDYWSIRLTTEQTESIGVRQGILQPISQSLSCGAFISVTDENGMGYAAANDLTSSGLNKAFNQAHVMASLAADKHVIKGINRHYPQKSGQYNTPQTQTWGSVSLSLIISILSDACKNLKVVIKTALLTLEAPKNIKLMLMLAAQVQAASVSPLAT